jgi:hypothetical protein
MGEKKTSQEKDQQEDLEANGHMILTYTFKK